MRDESSSAAAATRQQILVHRVLGGALIVLATLVAYWPALHGGFVWDDDAYVTNNELLTAPDGLGRIWFSPHHQSQYFPLVFTTLRLEYALWALNPLGYHLVNLGLHGCNALLVWTVLRRLAVPGAWLAAAVFALHPVQVETVAWVTELKNTQSTFFYLLALLAWLRFIAPEKPPPWRFYALALGLHALALFSKTTACTFPAALVLTLWLQQERFDWRRVCQIVPFVLLGLVMGLVSVWWEAHLGNFQDRYELKFSLVDRLLMATRALWFYFGKLIWPMDLTFSYPRWEINPSDPWQYLWGIGCGAVALLLWRQQRKLGRGVIAAVVFFGATLFPLLGFFPLFTFYYSFVADHYQYLACVGPIALFAAGLCWLARRCGAGAPVRYGVIAALLLSLGTLTWQQSSAYQSVETLWRDTIRKNPASWLARTNLGMVLAARGERAEAEVHYREALRLKPANGDAHYNFANLLFATGRHAEALEHFQAAVQLVPHDADMRNNLGVALHSLKQTAAAIPQFQEAVRLRPDLVSAHFNLGIAYESTHQRNEAIEQYREVLRLQPDSTAAKARLRVLGAGDALPAGPIRNPLQSRSDYRRGPKVGLSSISAML